MQEPAPAVPTTAQEEDQPARAQAEPQRFDRRPEREPESRRQEWPAAPPRREAPTGSRIRPEDPGEVWPEVPDWADPAELGGEVLRDLRGLSKENSDFVARHLVAATALADEEPEQAWLHARAARSKGGRIAVVRETVGIVAYRAEEWAEAISELRAARRMGGGPGHVAILADCERALGNPERALDLARSPEAAQLDPEGAAELRIVAAGARADLGQLDAALAILQDGDGFDLEKPQTYSARLYYAYADLLLTAGRSDEALQWFVRADDADDEGETDADERIADLVSARNDLQSSEADGTDSASAEPEATDGTDLTDGTDSTDGTDPTDGTDLTGDPDSTGPTDDTGPSPHQQARASEALPSELPPVADPEDADPNDAEDEEAADEAGTSTDPDDEEDADETPTDTGLDTIPDGGLDSGPSDPAGAVTDDSAQPRDESPATPPKPNYGAALFSSGQDS